MTTTSESTEGAMLDCLATVRKLWDYLDHELTPVEVKEVDEHLARCELCPPHFEFERAFLDAVRKAREERGASAAVRDRVRYILGLNSSPNRGSNVQND